MVIFHSYVSLPEGNALTNVSTAAGVGRQPDGAPSHAGRDLGSAAAAGAGQRQPGAQRRDAGRTRREGQGDESKVDQNGFEY